MFEIEIGSPTNRSHFGRFSQSPLSYATFGFLFRTDSETVFYTKFCLLLLATLKPTRLISYRQISPDIQTLRQSKPTIITKLRPFLKISANTNQKVLINLKKQNKPIINAYIDDCDP